MNVKILIFMINNFLGIGSVVWIVDAQAAIITAYQNTAVAHFTHYGYDTPASGWGIY